MKLLCKEITDQVLSAFYAVYNELGFGFLENVYQNALYKELSSMGLKCEPLKVIEVYYKGEVVGKYVVDMVVENEVILELKASSTLTEAHEIQLQNYLKATHMEVGLLLNFGARPEFRRKVFANNLHDRYKERHDIKKE